jgi:uncharacterized protein YycO
VTGPYAEHYREHPQPASGFLLASEVERGSYLCVQTASVFGWFIREATRSEVDHTVLAIGDGQIVEATDPGGVVVSPITKYAGRYAVACTDVMTARQRDTVVRSAMSAVGSEYNFATIGYQALSDLAGWHWAVLLHAAKRGHVFDCSQLAAWCGQQAHLDWMCGASDVALVTPAALARRPGVVPVTIV